MISPTIKAGLVILCALACAFGAEPITGKWLLKKQQVAGQERGSRPLTLRITQNGDALEFEYSVTVNQKQEISLRFTARLDGAEGDVTDPAGHKIGTAKLSRFGSSQYLVGLQGPNRPTSSGRLILSGDGKTLTSESDATAPNGAKAHTTQVFERQ